jgi:hypothetical protein
MPGVVDLMSAVGLTTDDPHEGSGPGGGSGPVAAHEWEPLPGSLYRGSLTDGLLPAVPPELRSPPADVCFWTTAWNDSCVREGI